MAVWNYRLREKVLGWHECGTLSCSSFLCTRLSVCVTSAGINVNNTSLGTNESPYSHIGFLGRDRENVSVNVWYGTPIWGERTLWESRRFPGLQISSRSGWAASDEPRFSVSSCSCCVNQTGGRQNVRVYYTAYPIIPWKPSPIGHWIEILTSKTHRD